MLKGSAFSGIEELGKNYNSHIVVTIVIVCVGNKSNVTFFKKKKPFRGLHIACQVQ